MRPKIKGDTYYFPTADGVYLRNNHDSFYLKGKVLAHLLDILSPYLNGKYTFDEIALNLPSDRQELLRKLVSTLTTKGFIQDVSTDLHHELSERELQAYEAEIAFIEAFVSSAPYHFEQYHNARVLLIGSGLTLTALVHSALHSGLSQIHILLTDECLTDCQRLLDYLELYRERDGRQQVHITTHPDWTNEDAVSLALQPFDALLHITDRAMIGRSRLLNRLAYKQQKILLQANVVDDNAWIGPLVLPEKMGCWECAWLRLQTNLQPTVTRPDASSLYDFEDFSTPAISRFVSAPTAAVTANLLNFELFKYLTGVNALETEGRLLAINLETLQSMHHAFVPHPFCSVCSSPTSPTASIFQETIEHLRTASAIEQVYFSNQATSLFDTRLGLFREIDEQDITQIPLNVSQVTFTLPRTALLRTITGQSTDFGAARLNATLRSFETYAADLYDARRGISASELRTYLIQSTSTSSIPCAPLIYNRQRQPINLPTTETSTEARYLWAWDLPSQTLAAVDAGVVFSPTRANNIPMDHDLAGVGSGMSWDEAIYHALLDHVRTQVLLTCRHTPVPFRQLNLADVALSPTAERYCHLLALGRAELAIYNLSDSGWGIPSFAFCLAGTTIAYTSDCDAAEALQMGLELALLVQQVGTDDQIYTPEPVYDLPVALRSSEQVTLATTHIPTLPERNTALLATFQKHGFVPLVVPLDHDPQITRVLPFLLKIVLGTISPQRGA